MKKSKSNYFNRELSWLSFNQRVLDQARREVHPLLERVKFVAISAANLHEFFMVRVGGLEIVANASNDIVDIAGWTADQQLEQIRSRVREMNLVQSDCLLNELEPEMEKHGIYRLRAGDINQSQREILLKRFKDETMSMIAPIAVDDAEAFPMLTGARLCMCVRLKTDFRAQLGPPSPPEESVEEAAERLSLIHI